MLAGPAAGLGIRYEGVLVDRVANVTFFPFYGPRVFSDVLYQTCLRDSRRPQRASALRSSPGEGPGRPAGSPPRRCGVGLRNRSRRGHRAPPRGVDVKATPPDGVQGSPRGPKRARKPQKPLIWAKMPKMALFGLFWPKWPFSAFPGPSREGGFTSTPRGGALYPPFSGPGGGYPKNPKKGDFGLFCPKMGKMGISAPKGAYPGLPAREGRRAPARGVDVKPPSREGLDPGSRVPGVPPGPQAPSGV